MTVVAVLLALSLTPATPGERGPEPAAVLAPPSTEALLERGWDELHDLDNDAAIKTFRDAQRRAPQSTRGYQGEAVALWLKELEQRQDLEVSKFIDSTYFADEASGSRNREVASRFEDLLSKASELAQQQLVEHPDSPDNLYAMGSIHGIRAGYAITVEHDTNAAFMAAKPAIALQRSVVEKDPEYWDAYLPLGLYDYVTGSLPFYVKWIAYLAGYRGNKDFGIRKLELAAFHGKTAARDAMVMLSIIYVRENRTEDALPLFEELKRKAPHNHVIRLNEAFCLRRLGRYLEAARSYAEALDVARPRARFRREEVRLLRASCLLDAGEARQALEETLVLLGDPGLAEDSRLRAELQAGQALDALGRREQALARYREVAKATRGGELRSLARKLLKKPFVPATPPASTAAEAD